MLRVRNVLAAAALAFMLHAAPSHAAPGDLDPSFSRDGKQGIDFGASFSRFDGAVLDVEQLADGTTTVVATSRTDIDADQNMNIVIARLEEDGSLDTSFSGDGREVVDPPGEQSWRGASIQPDGSVAVAGEQGTYPARDFAVARIRSDAILDPSFSEDGVQQVGFGPDSDDGATAVVHQPDGKLVVAGFAGGDPRDFGFARLRQDGELDSGFSADGRTTVAFGEGSSLNDLALSESGDVVAVGSVSFLSFLDLAVARLRPDGSPDHTFGDDGAERLDLGPDDEVCGGEAGQSVVVQSDGPIVIGGVSSFGCSIGPGAGRHSPLLVRLEQDGDLDPSFPVLTGLPVPDVDDVAVHPTGILGVGSSGQNWFPLRDFVLFRRQLDGAPDRSFPRPDGSVATNFDARKDEASALSVQGDGSVVVAGVLLTDSPDARVGIARYLMDHGRRDQDADGIRDKPDRCPRGYSKRRRGCPELKDDASLSLRLIGNGPSVDGFLNSNYLECMDRRGVLMLKRRPGRDRVVRSLKSEYSSDIDTGEFSPTLNPGRYYARARRSVEPVGICRALRSELVRIRN